LAALVTLRYRAVNKILFREADELSSFQEMSTLNGTSSREAPTRTALSLILNTSHGALGSPIPASRYGNVGGFDDCGSRGVLGNVHTTCPSGKFGEGLVSEFIKSNGESLCLCVVRVNEVKVRTENRVSVARFGKRSVNLAVLGLPLEVGFGIF